jgi:hypothetical protein
MRKISEILVQKEGCEKKEVGCTDIEYGVAMEGFSDNTVNLRVQVAENFFSS